MYIKISEKAFNDSNSETTCNSAMFLNYKSYCMGVNIMVFLNQTYFSLATVSILKRKGLHSFPQYLISYIVM